MIFVYLFNFWLMVVVCYYARKITVVGLPPLLSHNLVDCLRCGGINHMVVNIVLYVIVPDLKQAYEQP